MEYRRDIDGLRGIAVVLVVLFHAGFPGFSGGFIGVDVFFVISGFLITSIIVREIDEQRFSLIAFYERRARRILPALVAVVGCCVLLGWFVLMPSELKRLARSAIVSLIFASNFHFARKSGYFTPSAELEPLLHTWSVAVEEQFYLFFPLVLVALGALGQSHRALAVVIGMSAISLTGAFALIQDEPNLVFYLFVFRIWELGAGAVLALSAFSVPRQRLVRELFAVFALIGIILPATLFTSTEPFPGVAALSSAMGTTVLIWIGRTAGGSKDAGSLVNNLLSHRLLVGIGLISYSLYLWHWPIFSYLRILMGMISLPPLIATLGVAASFIAAWLSYRMIEQPFRKPPPGGMRRRPFVLALVSAVAIVGTTATVMDLSKGLPRRFTPENLAIAAAGQDRNSGARDCITLEPSGKLCSLGDSVGTDGKADFLLWGNSHAAMLVPGLDPAARANGQTGVFAGKDGCSPLLAVRKNEDKDCVLFNEKVWSWLERREDIDRVILAARWTLMVEGSFFGGETGPKPQWHWIGNPAERPVNDTSAALVEASLNDLTARIVASGRRVVLIGPVPEIGYNVPLVAARQNLLGWSFHAPPTAAEFAARVARTDRMMMRIAAKSPKIDYVRLSDLFCDTQVCRTRDADGIPLYFDDDHITSTTAATLVRPRLAEIWQPTAR